MITKQEIFNHFARFTLTTGEYLPNVTVSYETYGKLNQSGTNAVLITHAYTANYHAAGRYDAIDPLPGTWDGLIGPGKAIDTNKFFVVCSNNLGSCYGTTGPGCINPYTGKVYGPDFPKFTLKDTVAVQKLLLEHLGVKHLVAVAGWSYGGALAFQWAVSHPNFVTAIVPVVTGIRNLFPQQQFNAVVERLNADSKWNGGWTIDNDPMTDALVDIRVNMLKSYGIRAILANQYRDHAAREAEIRSRSQLWAKTFNANSLIVLRDATLSFDIKNELSSIRAKVLYVISNTDKLYGPDIGRAAALELSEAGVDSTYHEINTPYGHFGQSIDAYRWSDILRQFIDTVQK